MKKLILLLMIFVFGIVNVATAQSTWKDNSEVPASFANEVLELVNKERAKEHLKPLRLSNSLNHYAQVRAKEITKKFSHTRPSGYSCFTVIPKPYKTVGENIAAGQRSSKEVVQAWMDSPGHRENIMNPKFKELGMGYIYLPDSKYKHYWAQLFRARY